MSSSTSSAPPPSGDYTSAEFPPADGKQHLIQDILQVARPTIRDRILQFASAFAMLGLGLMVWSVLDPTWAPVMIGLTVGQGIGTFSFLLYLIVVVADLGIRRRLRRRQKIAAAAAATTK